MRTNEEIVKQALMDFEAGLSVSSIAVKYQKADKTIRCWLTGSDFTFLHMRHKQEYPEGKVAKYSNSTTIHGYYGR
jgi:hypothetical protein